MKFDQWLENNQIPFQRIDGMVYVDDDLLRPFEIELRKLFPDIEFSWEIQPNRRSDDLDI